MSRPMIRIHNIETDEVIDREMNDEELERWEIEQAQNAARVAAESEKNAQREALLGRLGISEEEARLLLS